MKRFASLLVAAVLCLDRVVFPVVVPVFCVGAIAVSCTGGCKSASQTAYVTAQTATITVEAMMGLWNEYVGQKHPGPEVELRVKAAYDNYRKADIALLTAGKAMLQSPDDPLAKSAWQQAEAALTASSGQIYSLLKELGVKLP